MIHSIGVVVQEQEYGQLDLLRASATMQ